MHHIFLVTEARGWQIFSGTDHTSMYSGVHSCTYSCCIMWRSTIYRSRLNYSGYFSIPDFSVQILNVTNSEAVKATVHKTHEIARNPQCKLQPRNLPSTPSCVWLLASTQADGSTESRDLLHCVESTLHPAPIISKNRRPHQHSHIPTPTQLIKG